MEEVEPGVRRRGGGWGRPNGPPVRDEPADGSCSVFSAIHSASDSTHPDEAVDAEVCLAMRVGVSIWKE